MEGTDQIASAPNDSAAFNRMTPDLTQDIIQHLFQNVHERLFVLKAGAIVVVRPMPGIVFLAACITAVSAVCVEVETLDAVISAKASLTELLLLNYFVV